MYLTVRDATKTYGTFTALDRVSIGIDKGVPPDAKYSEGVKRQTYLIEHCGQTIHANTRVKFLHHFFAQVCGLRHLSPFLS